MLSSELLEVETHCTCCSVLSPLWPGTLEVEVGRPSGPLDDKYHKDRQPLIVRSRHLRMGRVCERERLAVCNNHSPCPAQPRDQISDSKSDDYVSCPWFRLELCWSPTCVRLRLAFFSSYSTSVSFLLLLLLLISLACLNPLSQALSCAGTGGAIITCENFILILRPEFLA